jgi:hypothetical protein
MKKIPAIRIAVVKLVIEDQLLNSVLGLSKITLNDFGKQFSVVE